MLRVYKMKQEPVKNLTSNYKNLPWDLNEPHKVTSYDQKFNIQTKEDSDQ